MTKDVALHAVSVVIQGPRTPITTQTIAGLRTHLPGARLVLSTWTGTEVDDLDVDDVVLSDDPGGFASTTLKGIAGPVINTNRMVASTAAGLRAVDRPYTIKVRTDSVIEHGGCLWMLSDLPKATGEWALFEHLIGVSSVYTRNPHKTPTGCFHPADTVQFGHTSDLLTLWDVPPMPASDADYFPDPATRPVWSVTSQRYYPEQWMFVSALRKRYTVEFDHRAEFTDAVMEASNRAVAQNFLVAEPWQMGIRVPHLEAQLRWTEDPLCVMTHPIWHQMRVAATTTRRPHPWGPARPDGSRSPHTPAASSGHRI